MTVDLHKHSTDTDISFRVMISMSFKIVHLSFIYFDAINKCVSKILWKEVQISAQKTREKKIFCVFYETSRNICVPMALSYYLYFLENSNKT